MLFLDMQTKQLAALSGIKSQTIASYLGARAKIPSAEAAVRIAQALGVSVEYLVTGKDAGAKQSLAAFPPDMRLMFKTMEYLDTADRKIILALAAMLKNRKNAYSGAMPP
ncbi:MAG: helix-turn-helix transcriptional regulator [Spirochaetaceae bacterium]|nr:helix-turn-helix transcriptional regulator [Spirochaetaceae bacterium]